MLIGIKLSQQEHFNLGTRFLLVPEKPGWKNLGIIEDEKIILVLLFFLNRKKF